MSPHTHVHFNRKIQWLWCSGLVACWIGLAQPAHSHAHDLKPGDVLVSATSNGFPRGYRMFDNLGNPVLNTDGSQHTITDPNVNNNPSGGFFNWSDRKLYSASNNIYGAGPDDLVLFERSSPHEVAKRHNMNQYGTGNVWSIDRDQTGNIYVASGTMILKFSRTLELIKQFDVAASGYNPGVAWMDVTKDGSVIFYINSLSSVVFRFDTVNEVQLPEILMNNPEAPNPSCVKLLPPFDGSGGLLVGKSNITGFAAYIYRIDLQGTLLQTYHLAGEDWPQSIDLDPSGKSFWVTTYSSSDQTAPGGLLRIKLSGHQRLCHRFLGETPHSVVVVGNKPLWSPPDWPWRK